MSLFNLSASVGLVSTYLVTVRRFNADTYDTHGKAEARTYSEFTARMSVQPMSGKALKHMPEGTDSSDFVTVHSTTEIRVRDRLTVPGLGAFEIEKLNLWDVYGGFFRATARKLDGSEPRV